jgi:hypothetical protein
VAAKALSLNLTYYYNKVTILQYGGLARYISHYLIFIIHLKELAEALGYRTHILKILGSNPAALTFSF